MQRSRRDRLVESEAHFVEVEPAFVRRIKGFEVRFLGRQGLPYREGERTLRPPLDSLEDRLLVERSRVERWPPPDESEALTGEDRSRVAARVAAAMRRLRLGIEIA